ncbi:unnamed protein product [Hapterophycus canaliculatus]
MFLLLRRSSKTFLVIAALALEAKPDVEALDRRITVVLQLLVNADPIGAESELRDMAELYPSYAPASFFLGLLSQRRDEPETAVGFYAAALRAADPTHADATNNIGTALIALSPADRARVAEGARLLPLASEKKKRARARDGTIDSPVDTNPDTDDIGEVIECLFRQALELDPTHRWALNNLGLHLHDRDRNDEAVAVFTRALRAYPEDAEISYNTGVALQTLGMAQEAAQHFASVLAKTPQHMGAAINLATLHHRYGHTGDAVEQYRRAAEIIDPRDIDMVVMLRNNLGTALFQMGEHTLAKVEHRAVLAILEDGKKGQLHQSDGAGREFDTYVDTLVNLHRARKASCDWNGWESHIDNLKNQVDVLQLGFGRPPSLLPFDSLLLPFPVTPSWRRRIAEAHSMRYTGASVTWVAPDVVMTDESRTADLPLDQGSDDTVDNGKRLGAAHRGGGESALNMAEEGKIRRTGTEKRRAPLNIGFIGHDFSEHPTAHMIEGVFVWHTRLADAGRKRKRIAEALDSGAARSAEERPTTGFTKSTAAAASCRYSVYSYGGGGRGAKRASPGKDVDSTSSRARESIKSHASSFVDLYAAGHGESIERIRADGIDILVDLQGHTLGGRSEITAARPARLQVNYLIFPGTSGAPYMDYLLADRHVTPPEHAADYSESLVLLPRTYQANLYDDLLPAIATSASPTLEPDWAALRREQGLPDDLSRAVFVNFNKIDKLDPESFSLWMQILRRVPGSVLWLLEASSVDTERQAIRSRLCQEAESEGVDGLRIVWAKWVPKSEHLLRHAVADLFLDTLTYGAHSTATDALAGGLPFLTLAGASFASRVGVSLLRNAGPAQSFLLVAGQREYEDVAVELVSTSHGQKALKRIRASLREGRVRDLQRSRLENIEDEAVAHRHGTRARDGGGHPSLAIFDTEAITMDLNRAFLLMSDVHSTWNNRIGGAGGKEGVRLPNIILTRKKLDSERPWAM